MEQTGTTSSSSVEALGDKNRRTIVDYVGDMVALENHIEEALDRQLAATKDLPTAHAAVQRFHDQVKSSRDAIKAYQGSVGTTGTKPLAQAGAAILGVAAGLIDKIRTEGATKSLRDDYTAFNHAAIGYTLLHTTAMAFGDDRTAKEAERGLTTYAGMVQDLNHVIADVAIEELKRDGHELVNSGAAAENRNTVDRIWKQTANAGTSGKKANAG
jgi:ferritin-like metal-binding protein YciE